MEEGADMEVEEATREEVEAEVSDVIAQLLFR